MSEAERPRSRPWAINLFAAILLTFAMLNLATALFDLPAQEEALRSLGLGLEWNRDWTIVASSAWFTIELIPIALVWLFASLPQDLCGFLEGRSRFARLFLLAMAALKAVLMLSNLPMLYALPGLLAGHVITIGAIALLFTHSANRWFNPPDRPDPRAFD